MRRSLVLVAALTLAVLGACGGGGGGASKCPPKVETKTATGGAIRVCGSDIKFDVDTIRAEPGPLRITMVNAGDIVHTLRIPDADFKLSANPGKTVNGTVTLSEGTYAFDCDVPGHAAAGMKGTIVVG
jgi:plastocyanin